MDVILKKTCLRWANRLANLILWAAGIVGAWVLLKVFVFASYHVPSDSMMPALWPGDYVLVEKLSYGARLFDLEKAAAGKPFEMHRTWRWGSVKRGDVVVFNNPYPHSGRKLEFDLMQYYVKRCIALPGDSFEIRHGRYQVRGCAEPLGNVRAQDDVFQALQPDGRGIYGLNSHAFPKWDVFKWSILEFGPLYLPRRGDTLPMNTRHYWLYKKLIEWETGKQLELNPDSTVCLNGHPVKAYTFCHDYYFMAGDNASNSNDSRYWGLVPDDFIAGRAVAIWMSVKPYSGKRRWNRIGLIQ